MLSPARSLLARPAGATAVPKQRLAAPLQWQSRVSMTIVASSTAQAEQAGRGVTLVSFGGFAIPQYHSRSNCLMCVSMGVFIVADCSGSALQDHGRGSMR